MRDAAFPAETSPDTAGASRTVTSRKRMTPPQREAQILAGAIAFFSLHGIDGQMRMLANEIGVTHALLYHYFPTKQALIERVYSELFEGRWKPEWEVLLDDPKRSVEEKLYAFYCDYSATVLTRDFVRIFLFSGLNDRYISDRFFTLLRARLFPRLVRETRRYCGVTSRRKPCTREFELLMGLHGGIFYIGVRKYIYGQAGHAAEPAEFNETTIRDRVQSYLLSAATVLSGGDAASPVLPVPVLSGRSPAEDFVLAIPSAPALKARATAVAIGSTTLSPLRSTKGR